MVVEVIQDAKMEEQERRAGIQHIYVPFYTWHKLQHTIRVYCHYQ